MRKYLLLLLLAGAAVWYTMFRSKGAEASVVNAPPRDRFAPKLAPKLPAVAVRERMPAPFSYTAKEVLQKVAYTGVTAGGGRTIVSPAMKLLMELPAFHAWQRHGQTRTVETGLRTL